MLHKLSLILICISVVSCSGKHDQLNRALKFAGSNRPELEKVLEHYSRDPVDSLKLRAAVFLIENMPGHYSVSGKFVDQLARDFYAGNIATAIQKHAALCTMEYYLDQDQIERKDDITCITSDFLIRHIDKVFLLWGKMPWRNEYSFDTFCEYALPYRVDNEPLEYLESATCELPVDSLYAIMNKYSMPISDIHSYRQWLVPQGIGNLPAPFDKNEGIGCAMLARYDVIADRLMGIPATIDHIASFGNRSGYHEWPVVFGVPGSYTVTNKCPKVYRRTFSRQDCPEDNGVDFIPHIFRHPFDKDVTGHYVDTEDVTVKIKGRSPKYLYLGVFDVGAWFPVAWSKVKGGRAHFEQMGTGNVYQALYYDGTRQIAVGNPFILGPSGEQRELKPQKDLSESLHLVRKYPLNAAKWLWHNELHGMVIEASNDPDFSKADTLYIATGKDIDLSAVYEVRLQDHVPYRYLRCVPRAMQAVVTLAEIGFFDLQGNGLPVEITSKLPIPRVDQLIDGDPLTFAVTHRSIVFDLGQSREISLIRFRPRNDDNYIHPGEIYELLYRDRDNWQSLGVQTATGYALDYGNVPSGALYWLRNLTKGREERPFTVENGRIVFW